MVQNDRSVNADKASSVNPLSQLQAKDEDGKPSDKVDENTHPAVEENFLDITIPSAPMSPYHLVYEELSQEPWKVLIGSVLMKSANATTNRCMVLNFFKKFPNLASINENEVIEFLTQAGHVPMLMKLAQNIMKIAQSLLDRVPRLEDVPVATAYSRDVFRVFCLQQFSEKDIKDIASYDLRAYVRWRLSNK